MTDARQGFLYFRKRLRHIREVRCYNQHTFAIVVSETNDQGFL